MRLIISALLLASVAAVPAAAQDRPHGDWHQGGGDHGDHGGGDHGGGRPPGAPGGGEHHGGTGQPNGGGRPVEWAPHGGVDSGHHVAGRPDNGVQVWRDDHGHGDWGHGNDGRGNGDRGGPGGWNGDHGRPGWNSDRGRPGGPGGWDGDHGRPGGWNGDHGGGWNRGWRDDHRYDWRGWRDTHRDIYRGGGYRPPSGRGWGYRRWGVGGRIDPVFFAQNYWISDPWYYRLPPAYGSYRWVRYYNDALLIDTYTGTVIDEIPDFFW